MSREQLTDAQLSERVCKALGIEPKITHTVDCVFTKSHWHRPPCDCEGRRVYPSVLDWPGFGRVVERLEGIGLHFTFSNYPSGHMVELWPAADVAYGTADTLPRALALAVLEWEASR